MYRLTAFQLHKQFCDGTATAENIVSYFLKRIEACDPKIGAFLSVYHERALEKARLLDQKRQSGKPYGRLAGIPVGIKDNIHVKGETTTCASKFLANYKAVFDATVTHLLEQQDAIVMGKLNLDEFAMGSSNENSAFQNTYNPWNLGCVPGGSSGGSTAAVAARLCPVSLGTDTGGSVRQPAAFCGVTGLKPTYGRVSRYGLVAFGSSLDQIGPIAASIQDIGMIMEVIGRQDPYDATSLPLLPEEYLSMLEKGVQGKRVGVPWEFLEELEYEPKNNFMEAVEWLKKLGCEVVDVDLNILKYSIASYYIIATAEASTNLARFDGIRYGVRSKDDPSLEALYEHSRSEGFGPEVKKRILLGTFVLSSGYQDAFYKQATRVRQKIIEAFDLSFKQCEVIATPVSPTPAFPIGNFQDPLQMYLQDIYTIGVNLARLPAISIPSGFNREKKPFGLQLIGAKRSEVLICRFGHAFEKATGYFKEIPPLFDKEFC